MHELTVFGVEAPSFLREPLTTGRVVAAVLIVAGLILMKLSSTA